MKDRQKPITRLGFGCMRFPTKGGKIDLPHATSLLRRALERGVNFFDTAYIYTGHEVAVGKIFQELQCRDDVYLSTKLPLYLVKTAEDLDKFFDEQLSRLKTDYIDYYFLHSLGTPAVWEKLKSLGIEDWIARKKQSGQIHHIGFSFHGESADFIQLLDAYPWDFTMIQYNYLCENYQAGKAGLHAAHKRGLPVFIMNPLLGGHLAKRLPKQAQQLLTKADNSRTFAQWALRWVLDQPEVTMVLSGMQQLSDVEENLDILAQSPPNCMAETEQQTIRQVQQIVLDSYKIPCNSCGYCKPCPKGISIPDIFSAYNASYAFGRLEGFQQFAQTTGAGTDKHYSIRTCINCGACSPKCPQKIDIVARLEDVQKRLEPWWYRLGVKLLVPMMRWRSR